MVASAPSPNMQDVSIIEPEWTVLMDIVKNNLSDDGLSDDAATGASMSKPEERTDSKVRRK